MNVFDYIAHESKRQSATYRETLGMYDAWRDWSDRKPGLVSEAMLLDAARRINGLTDYRLTPVYFRSGGHSANHTNIPRLMKNLVEAINSPTMWEAQDRLSDVNLQNYFTKTFLDIHPFADGNGRVGSILWNFLRGSINDPEPMPYFFGENDES